MIFTATPHCGALAMALALVSVSCSTTSDRYRALASELERAAPQGRMEREHHAALEGNSDGDDPFPGAATLERGALIMQVLARHPTLDAARNAWRAALAEVEQTQAFDDPMVAYRVAPLSISLPGIAPDAPFGHEIMLSQTMPFPGRRERAGDRALADVELARLQHHAAQLDLALAAAHLHADYVTNASKRAFTNEFATLVEQMRGSAAAQFEAGRGSLQDPLYAELELAHLEHDKIRLDAEGTVIVAHINSLLHRRPKAALPPAPLWAAAPGSGHHHADDEHEHEDEDLEGLALASRPDLAAARARIEAARAEVATADLAWWPDLSLNGSYNSMWDLPQHQWMIGASINVPIFGARDAASVGAHARMNGAESEEQGVVDEVRTEVEVARERVVAARHIVGLNEDRVLPAARARVAAARAALESGSGTFIFLIESEKELRDALLLQQVALADLDRRRAELDRSVGRLPGAVSPTARTTGAHP